MKTHYSCAELAAMKLPEYPTAINRMRDRVRAENWPSREVPGKGGKSGLRTEYQPPKAVMEIIKKRHDQQVLDKVFSEQKQLPAPIEIATQEVKLPIVAKGGNKVGEIFKGGAMVRRGLVRRVKEEGRLTDVDRARRDAALMLCQAIDMATVMTHQSAAVAMRDMAERIISGVAKPELIDAARVTYIKPRQDGWSVTPLVARLSKMYAAYLQGRDEGDIARYLVPGHREKTGQEPIHIHAFLLFFCKPSRPPVTEAWRAAQGWFEAQSLPCPAVDTFYRIEKALPPTLKYRGRMTGSEWRALKPYVSRDVSMFSTNDLWVGDGHSFKAKVQHPIHGRPFIPEVTVVLDWVSRRSVGWSVTLSENCVAVSDAFRHAQQQSRARPLIYYSDNGSGQTGKTIDCPIHGALARQGIVHETGIPGNPQGRGIIERWWQTTLIPLARTYPTCQWKGSDKETVRKMLVAIDKEGGKGASIVPAFGQFLIDLEAELGWEGRYNTTPHSELDGRTPAQEYERRLSADSACCGPSDAELSVLWMPEVKRIPDRGLIRLFNNEYFNKTLVDVLSEGEAARVRYDLQDAKQVWVMRMDGTYLCEAKFEGNKRDAFPKARIEQIREERVAGQIGLAEKKIERAKADLAQVIEGETLIKVEFPQVVREELTRVEWVEKTEEKKASYMDTVMMLYGNKDAEEDDAGVVAVR